MLRRYITLLVFALWMGGFTFYTLVVIPTGSKVLGGDRDQGFITQQVTNWLNLIGSASILFLIWDFIAEGRGKRIRLLQLAWLGMLLLQIALFFIHPVIDRLLDPATHKIHDFPHFYNWHRAYMAVASLQWLCALAYLWLTLRLWRKNDRQTVPIPS